MRGSPLTDGDGNGGGDGDGDRGGSCTRIATGVVAWKDQLALQIRLMKCLLLKKNGDCGLWQRDRERESEVVVSKQKRR